MRTATITAAAKTPPPPQADRLTVVTAVVDAIASGCSTADEIADAIGMSGRQGCYYPNAAWTLGYAEPDHSTSPAVWFLTDRGQALAGSSPSQRVDDLTSALLELDELAIFTAGQDGAGELADSWSKAGLGEDTIHRRLQTIGSWTEFLTADRDRQEDALATAAATARSRAPQACERAAQQRRDAAEAAARAAAKKAPALGAVCGRCFLTMPLTGKCGNCD